MPATHRTVVEEIRFSRELRAIQTNPHRADELIDAVKWTLSKEPRAGVQVAPRSPVWFIAVDLPREPSLGIYYTFKEDGDTVHLISIRRM